MKTKEEKQLMKKVEEVQFYKMISNRTNLLFLQNYKTSLLLGFSVVTSITMFWLKKTMFPLAKDAITVIKRH